MSYLKNLFVFLLTFALLAGVASALPVTIDEFELDDVELTPNSPVRLDLDRDKEYPVRIKFTPTSDLEDVQFILFVSGYEYSHYKQIADSTATDSYSANITRTERMTLTLPSDIDVDDGNYRLRLLITDADSDLAVFEYYIKVSSPRHSMTIEDVVLSPAGQIESGKALYANARVHNNGRSAENDVKLIFSIPELNVRTSAYIEEVEAGEEEELEDGVTLMLPSCAEEREYAVEVAALYDNKHKEVVAEERLWVVESPKCKKAEATPIAPVVVPQEPVAAEPGSTGKIRSALEVALLVLVGLLVVIGLIIGFSKLGSKDDF